MKEPMRTAPILLVLLALAGCSAPGSHTRTPGCVGSPCHDAPDRPNDGQGDGGNGGMGHGMM